MYAITRMLQSLLSRSNVCRADAWDEFMLPLVPSLLDLCDAVL